LSEKIQQEDKAVANCIFCGKSLKRDEIVRYHGAISCQECAEKAKKQQERFTSPLFFIIGGIGALIAAVGSIGYILASLFAFAPGAVYPWIVSGYSLLSLGLALLSVGYIGLYFNWDRKWGFVLAICSLIGCVGGLIYLNLYLTLGPPGSWDMVTPPIYIISQYVFEGGLFISLALSGALIILTRDDHGIEVLTLATAGASLLGSAITYFLLPALTLLSIYFLTARAVWTSQPPVRPEVKRKEAYAYPNK
jgi:predicted nucleic acid-binding Zn ribbon protein